MHDPLPADAVPRPLQPLLVPGTYFADRAPNLPVRPAIAAAVVASLLSVLASALAVWALIAQIPPDATFQVNGETVGARAAATDVGRRVVGYQIPGAFLGWAAFVVAVHLGAALDETTGDLTDSAAVASWAYVPTAVESVVRAALVWTILWPREPAGSIDALQRRIDAMTTGLQSGFAVAVQVVVAAWMGYVVYQGLHRGRDFRADGAALVGGSIALFWLMLALV